MHHVISAWVKGKNCTLGFEEKLVCSKPCTSGKRGPAVAGKWNSKHKNMCRALSVVSRKRNPKPQFDCVLFARDLAIASNMGGEFSYHPKWDPNSFDHRSHFLVSLSSEPKIPSVEAHASLLLHAAARAPGDLGARAAGGDSAECWAPGLRDLPRNGAGK